MPEYPYAGIPQSMVKQPELVFLLSPPCPHCGVSTSITMTPSERYLWLDPDRPNIQQCFPDWDADKRELLLTGFHKECWDEVFLDSEGNEY